MFYMTPQAFENDLKMENCDLGDIILLVVAMLVLSVIVN